MWPCLYKGRWKEIGAADHFECSAILSDYYTWFNCDILRKGIETVQTKTQNDRIDILSSLKSYADNTIFLMEHL